MLGTDIHVIHGKNRKVNNPFHHEKVESWHLNKKNVILTIYIPLAIVSFLSIAAFSMAFMAVQHHKPDQPKIVWNIPKAYPAIKDS